MAQGFLIDGVTGASTPDSLDPSFASNPSAWITRRRAEAKTHGLRYMISMPQGRVPGLYASNLFAALLPQVRTALCAINEPWYVYTGFPPANDWPGTPTKLDTMPPQDQARAMPLDERRAWAAMNLAPLMALSKLRGAAFDYSQKSPAELSAIEAYLRRHEAFDVWGELPPTIPGVGNDLILDTDRMVPYPSIGWMGAWGFCSERKLHLSRVPSGIECHLSFIPDFGAGFDKPPTNFPDLNEVGKAKFNGWTLDLYGGWPIEMGRRILAAPPVNQATDAA